MAKVLRFPERKDSFWDEVEECASYIHKVTERRYKGKGAIYMAAVMMMAGVILSRVRIDDGRIRMWKCIFKLIRMGHRRYGPRA